MKNIIMIISTFIFFSCATTKNYTEVVKSWEGSDINELIMSWGNPSVTYTMPNGNKRYTWLYENNRLVTTYMQNPYYQNVGYASTRQVQNKCETTFTTNENGIIIHWSWKGNACRSTKK